MTSDGLTWSKQVYDRYVCTVVGSRCEFTHMHMQARCLVLKPYLYACTHQIHRSPLRKQPEGCTMMLYGLLLACTYLPYIALALCILTIIFCSVLRKHAPLFKRTDAALQCCSRRCLQGNCWMEMLNCVKGFTSL